MPGNDAAALISYGGDSTGGLHVLRARQYGAVVTDLVIQDKERKLIEGTYGRGAWLTGLAGRRVESPASLPTDGLVRMIAWRSENVEGTKTDPCNGLH